MKMNELANKMMLTKKIMDVCNDSLAASIKSSEKAVSLSLNKFITCLGHTDEAFVAAAKEANERLEHDFFSGKSRICRYVCVVYENGKANKATGLGMSMVFRD